MKRTFILAAVCLLSLCLIAGTVSAQDQHGWVMKTVKAGITGSSLIGDDTKINNEPLGTLWGLTGGVAATYQFTEKLAVQPEVMLTTKGATISGATNKLSDQLYYLEVPVLLKLVSGKKTGVRPSLYAGPSLAIKLNNSFKVKYRDPAQAQDDMDLALTTATSVDPTAKSYDLGATVGVDFFAMEERIIVDVRYTMGLQKLDKDDAFDARNSSFGILLGYTF